MDRYTHVAADKRERLTRRAAMIAFGGGAALLAAGSAGAQELTPVTVGIVNTSSDVPYYIADRLGYFKEVGIAAKFIPFDGAPKMIAPLGAGQLDVGSGAPSAGLYNAISSKVEVKMVADKGSAPREFGFGPLMVRKELVTSGRYKSPRDLKGMRFAESAPGSVLSSTISRLMHTVGLTYNDVSHVFLGFPQQIAAFAGGAIDAALTAEPSATLAERSGVAVRVLSNDRWYPDQEQSTVIYGSSFLKSKRELGNRFMVAWIRGARFFNDALVHGHIRGRTSQQVIDILTEATAIKDRTVYSEMTSNACDPNGRMNLASLDEDLRFFKELHLVQNPVTVAEAIDTSFQESALRTLGRYHRHA